MTGAVEFFVAGRPVPKARPRVTRFGTYTPRTTAEWERLVASTFDLLCRGVFFGAGVPVRFSAEIVCPGRGGPASIRGDADNYGKALKDALNGRAYSDDVQIVDSRVTKRRARKGEQTGARVRIERAGEI